MKDGFLKAAAAAPKIRVADPAWNALEICKALDISATNAWVMLHRARLFLRECLDGRV